MDPRLLVEAVFRENPQLALQLRSYIAKLLEKLGEKWGSRARLKIMDFCGTHEWTITHYGLRTLMPKGLELVAGPGCPVCVTPSWELEEAMKLSFKGVTVYTYGDSYRLRTVSPVNGAYSLAEARALGGSVKVVTSIYDAIADARKYGKEAVFLGIGFETVAPGYAHALLAGLMPENLSLMSLVRLTPPAMFYSLSILREKPPEPPVMGVIAPGHVSTITGAKAWVPVAEAFEIPVVVAGFEPIDVMMAVALILRQLLQGRAEVEIEYKRAVSFDGDLRAQAAIHKAFEVSDAAWRGIGFLPRSGLRVREKYSEHDARTRYGIREMRVEEWKKDTPPGCKCAEVVLGKAKPTDCPLFLRKCTPSTPYGPCMVSMEGTCAIWARFGEGGVTEDMVRELGLLEG
ncbi:MAG: hydrogenase formation protein HypD [Acidilobaceae archaeon]|nr:hydrogenase formation protein HypD [Acidilobaceae archaeon]